MNNFFRREYQSSFSDCYPFSFVFMIKKHIPPPYFTPVKKKFNPPYPKKEFGRIYQLGSARK